MATLQSRLASLITVIGADVKSLTTAVNAISATYTGLINQAYTDTAPTPMWKTTMSGTIATTLQNIEEHWIGSFLAGYKNEWGALRGQNPYSTFADSLVRAIIPATGAPYTGASGNYIELQDRRIAVGAGRTVHGRRWSDGRLMRKDNLVTESYTWNYGDADPTTGGTIPLPAGVQWILVFTSDAATQPLPSWAPSGCLTVRPS